MTEIIIGTSALILVVVVLCAISRCNRVNYEKRYPPISDDEFMAQCTPAADPSIALKVRRIVAEGLGVEYERIHPSTRFTDDFGCD